MNGYANAGYARSLTEFGTPRVLPGSGGWLLERQIPGTPYRDAMGCYPLFACRDWSQLLVDLDGMEEDLVSLSVVTDPFGAYDTAYLRRCFPDVVVPFKEHFVTDLRCPTNAIVSKHHRYYARRALEEVRVEQCRHPTRFVDEWMDLYANLVRRHDFGGIKAFSKAAFAEQLGVPGLVMFRAMSRGATVAAHLWYVQGEVAYSHLAASTPLGYESMAAYALYWSAIEHLSHRVRWLDLGAGAGIEGSGTRGLSRFKRGWATGNRTAYLCGRIFDHARYQELASARGGTSTGYFPAYREGEFG